MGSELALPFIAAFIGMVSLFTDVKTNTGRVAAFILAILLISACLFQIQKNVEDTKSSDWQRSKIDQLTDIIHKFKSRTYSSLDEILSYVRTFGLTEENPSASQIKESLEADKLRAKLAKEEPPSSRSGITVQYFPKDVDGSIVRSALEELGFKVSTGVPGIPNVPTNAIFYGDGVPLNSVKLVSTTLLRAGVKIKFIRPFQNSNGRKTLIQVGAGTAYIKFKPLTVEAIRRATEFPIKKNDR